MANVLLRSLRRLYQALASLVVVLFLGAATWLMAYLYLAEHRYNQFVHEGQPVTVRISETHRHRRELADQFAQAVYARFTYQQRSYEVRCTNSNPYSLSAGDRLHLLYHPGLDAFAQPRPAPAVRPQEVVSPLVGWSVLSRFNKEYRLLAGLVLAGSFLFFALGGLFAMLTGLTFLQPVAQAVLVVMLAGAALFFTYDAVQLYEYVETIKTEGRSLEVQVSETTRRSIGGKSVARYTYRAAFQFNGQRRVIAIDETEYDRLHDHPGPLSVRYHAELNDFLSVEYGLGLWLLVTPLFFWIGLGVFFWKTYLT